MNKKESLDPSTNWENFRSLYGVHAPALLKVADALQAGGLEFLSYNGDLRCDGHQVAVLRVADCLGDRYALCAAKGRPLQLARLESGHLTLLPILSPRENETFWQSVARSIWHNSFGFGKN